MISMIMMMMLMMMAKIKMMMLVKAFDGSPLAHLRSMAREKITALSPGFKEP